ncbi:C40 family peptidase [Paenibacillus sp. DS2015]|uniref:C40 family peptidase n=1 Tax=Paenibacillus sp. DS2015 TaxID=3373917 RepID=UPI003D1E7DBF
MSSMLAVGAEVSQAATSSTISSTKAKNIINYGKKFMGKPYKFGASTSTTANFDCSSLMKRIYSKYGVTLPRTSVQQSKVGKAVSKANLKAGDLVFFSSGGRANGRNVTHVGIYIGSGKMLHTYGSPGVMISDINKGNWKKTYLKARRVL